MGSTFTHSLTEPIFHPTPNYNDFLYHMPSMNADDESVRGWLREWFGCTKEAGEETWMLDHGRYFVDFLKLERVSINGWEIRAYSTVELATVLYTSSLTAFAARHIALDVKIAKKLEVGSVFIFQLFRSFGDTD